MTTESALRITQVVLAVIGAAALTVFLVELAVMGWKDSGND